MRCSHIIESSGKRCVRSSPINKCYQHKQDPFFPQEIENLIYTYSFDELPIDLSLEFWNNLIERKQINSFLRSFDLPETFTYDEFLIYSTLIKEFPKERILELLEGKGHIIELMLSAFEIKRIETIIRLMSKFPYEKKLYVIRSLPLRGIEDEKKLVDSLTFEYYTELFTRAGSEETRDYILNKVTNQNYFMYDWLLDIRIREEARILDAIDYVLKRGIPIPHRFINEYVDQLSEDSIIKHLRTVEHVSYNFDKDTIKRCMKRIDPRNQAIEATKLLNRIQPSRLNIDQLEAFLEFGADPSKLRKKMEKWKNFRESAVYKRISK